MCNCNGNASAASFEDPTTKIPVLILLIGGVAALALIGSTLGSRKKSKYARRG
jgi:hypothetical protein